MPPVNFYRATQSKEPTALAQTVALTFLGARAENWPTGKLAEMAAFFGQVGYKSTGEWKEEIVFHDPGKATNALPVTVFPDGTPARLAADQDPRELFADWLIRPPNPWFTRNIANRVWAWLLGRGIIHEPDDIRADNPPSNPELLAYLERELVGAKYDLKHLYRLILNSQAYQLSAIPATKDAKGPVHFASYPLRRLEAEVLIDAISQITGGTEKYSSPIPEPFTFIPEEQRSIVLADASISSPFLELYGRSARDTGLESERNNRPSAAQRLHLLNSSHIRRKLEQGPKLRALLQGPRLSPREMANKYSIIRSVTHGNNGHETASYMVQTGRPAGERIVYPSTGAVVSLFKGVEAGYQGLVPPYIVLTQPQGRFSEAGFLNSKFKPFATGGDPARTPFAVEGVVAPGVTEQQQRDRRDLLHQLDTFGHALPGHAELQVLAQSEEQAYDQILGEGRKLFDLTTEKQALRDAYGLNTFGQSCLMARRLVEKGVPYITINYGGWDTHKQHFQTMRRKLPELDKGMGMLLQDLHDHGLLDSTIVWWSGEFGRTPKVDFQPPWSGGRGHWGKCFSSVLAGGGFKGGHVVGASDDKGQEVKDRPVYPVDLIGSIYGQLGIDTRAKLPHPQGLDVNVLPTAADGIKTAGRLTEIV